MKQIKAFEHICSMPENPISRLHMIKRIVKRSWLYDKKKDIPIKILCPYCFSEIRYKPMKRFYGKSLVQLIKKAKKDDRY